MANVIIDIQTSWRKTIAQTCKTFDSPTGGILKEEGFILMIRRKWVIICQNTRLRKKQNSQPHKVDCEALPIIVVKNLAHTPNQNHKNYVDRQSVLSHNAIEN